MYVCVYVYLVCFKKEGGWEEEVREREGDKVLVIECVEPRQLGGQQQQQQQQRQASSSRRQQQQQQQQQFVFFERERPKQNKSR